MKHPFLLASALLVVLPTASACSDEGSPASPGAGTDAGSPEASAGGDDAGSSVPTCPAPKNGPTTHETDITADETWSADRSPHIVKAPLTLRQQATLTIEPCAEIRFAPGAGIAVSIKSETEAPKLRAVGTLDRPIRFTADGAEAWSAITVLGRGTIELANATLEKGGAVGPNNTRGATIRALGGAGSKPVAMLGVDTVTIAGSTGLGIELMGNAGFSTTRPSR